jgi:hypothetical protein
MPTSKNNESSTYDKGDEGPFSLTSCHEVVHHYAETTLLTLSAEERLVAKVTASCVVRNLEHRPESRIAR